MEGKTIFIRRSQRSRLVWEAQRYEMGLSLRTPVRMRWCVKAEASARYDSGEFITAFAPLPPHVWTRARVARLPFPLGEPGCHLFSRGRHGLWQGIRALSLRAGDEVLAPSYHHGSEIEALVQGGLVCRFYGAGDTLLPDEAELESLLTPRTRALHLIHYLGFPQDAAHWRRWCDTRGLLLIEDAAQAWLATIDGRPVGSFGDLVITCLYKTFGLPDGAAVTCRAPLAGVDQRRRLGIGALCFEQALWLSTRSSALGRLVRRLRAARQRRVDADFALGEPTLPPYSTTRWALSRIADAGAAAARRGHYARLLERFAARVPTDFRILPPGASPLAFPIFSRDKPRLIERLAIEGIRALDLWSIPHPGLPAGGFPYAARLRASLVGMPVHQELRLAHLGHISDALERAEP
jgi:dTDP-4-amino-4,6-dideoxygalactose transaminase